MGVFAPDVCLRSLWHMPLSTCHGLLGGLLAQTFAGGFTGTNLYVCERSLSS